MTQLPFDQIIIPCDMHNSCILGDLATVITIITE